MGQCGTRPAAARAKYDPFVIAIPTCRTAEFLRDGVLAYLLGRTDAPAGRIFLFPAAADAAALSAALAPTSRGVNVVGVPGDNPKYLAKLNFIETYFPPGTRVVMVQDRVCSLISHSVGLPVYNKRGEIYGITELITKSFELNSTLWGIMQHALAGTLDKNLGLAAEGPFFIQSHFCGFLAGNGICNAPHFVEPGGCGVHDDYIRSIVSMAAPDPPTQSRGFPMRYLSVYAKRDIKATGGITTDAQRARQGGRDEAAAAAAKALLNSRAYEQAMQRIRSAPPRLQRGLMDQRSGKPKGLVLDLTETRFNGFRGEWMPPSSGMGWDAGGRTCDHDVSAMLKRVVPDRPDPPPAAKVAHDAVVKAAGAAAPGPQPVGFPDHTDAEVDAVVRGLETAIAAMDGGTAAQHRLGTLRQRVRWLNIGLRKPGATSQQLPMKYTDSAMTVREFIERHPRFRLTTCDDTLFFDLLPAAGGERAKGAAAAAAAAAGDAHPAITEGAAVTVSRKFQSNDAGADKVLLQRYQRGTVIAVYTDGDALVAFDGIEDPCWVKASDFCNLSATAAPPPAAIPGAGGGKPAAKRRRAAVFEALARISAKGVQAP